MTTYVEARNAIVAYFNPKWVAAYPTIPVFYENTVQIDLDSVGDIFLTVSIDFTDSLRMGVDAAPGTETFGDVTLRLFTKEGTGTLRTLQVFDWLTATMKYKDLAGVTLGCPDPGPKVSKTGWLSSDLYVPFSFFQ